MPTDLQGIVSVLPRPVPVLPERIPSIFILFCKNALTSTAKKITIHSTLHLQKAMTKTSTLRKVAQRAQITG